MTKFLYGDLKNLMQQKKKKLEILEDHQRESSELYDSGVAANKQRVMFEKGIGIICHVIFNKPENWGVPSN